MERTSAGRVICPHSPQPLRRGPKITIPRKRLSKQTFRELYLPLCATITRGISVFTPYLLKSRIDLLPGMSGGPVSCLVMDHGIYYYAVGINVGETAQANYARRITSELISEMEENGLFDRGMTGDAFPKP